MSAGSVTTIVGAEVGGRSADVRIEDGWVVALGDDLPRAGTEVIDAGGGALIPGLHDHHLHLLAMGAAERSLDVAGAVDAAGFDAALGEALAAGVQDDGHGARPWLRVVGYDERHGPLDAARLDRLAPGRRVRVQHRSGAAWVVSSAGLAAVGVTSTDGWVHRADDDLGRRWSDEPPDLAGVGRRLAALGVTGVTDATPFADAGGLALLAAARADGAIPQRVMATGGPLLADLPPPPGLVQGPVKVVVADDALPSPDALATALRAARGAGRPVAVHCVTRVGLVLALAAWREVGAMPGDRIEHGSVVPVELLGELAELGLVVVTQPAFVWAHGDRYLADVEPDDVAHLYRCGSLDAAGIGVAASTDAPFGPADPWLAMRTAVDRRTASGHHLGASEAVTPTRALEAFLGALDDPAGPPRRVEVGAPADLCLLDAPLDRVLADLSAPGVVGTWIAGRRVAG